MSVRCHGSMMSIDIASAWLAFSSFGSRSVLRYSLCSEITTTKYIIANTPSPPVCFESAVIVYHRRFQNNPAVMLTYHRRFVIRPGSDALDNITAGL